MKLRKWAAFLLGRVAMSPKASLSACRTSLPPGIALSPPGIALVGWAHGKAALAVSMALVLALGMPACSKSETPSEPAALKSAPERTRPPPAQRIACKEPTARAHFMLGEAGKPPLQDGEQEAEAIDLPFAVEVGSAVPTRDGFAVAALKADRALLALVALEGGRGRVLELAKVFGDVEPPKLASRDEHLIAAIVGNDAGSQTLTLARIDPAADAPDISLGNPVSQGRDASSAFDLVLGKERGLLVWDRWDKAKGYGSIEALGFDPKSLEALAEPSVLSGADDDAEMPRVLPRPGGFWLFWVSHGKVPTEKPAVPGKPAAAKAAARVDAEDGAGEALESLVDQAPRRLKVVPLDHAARPAGEPISLTAPDAHVLGYDALPFESGALVTWRDDPTVLGAEAPQVFVAIMTADGNLDVQVIQDDEIAAGTPRLFHDRGAKPAAEYWLSLMGKEGAPRLGHFGRGGKLAGPLHAESRLRSMEPLTLHGSRLLLGRPNGRALDLSVVHCALEAVPR